MSQYINNDNFLKELESRKLIGNPFKGCEFDFNLILDGLIITETLGFENCNFKSLSLNDSVFKKGLYIIRSNLEQIVCNNFHVHDDFTVNNVFISGDVRISNSEFGGKCNIGDGKSISVTNCKGDVNIHSNSVKKIESINIAGFLEGSLKIVSDTYLNADLDKPAWNEITQLIIQADITKDSDIYRAKIDDIRLNGYNNKSRLRLDTIESNSIKIIDYINTVESGLILNNIEPSGNEPEFILVSSDLSKSQIRNCNLQGFTSFVFYNTEMRNVISQGTQWPVNAKYEEYRTFLCRRPDFSDKAKKSKQKELYYRTIKNIMNMSGERADELNFRKMELDQKLINSNFSQYPLAVLSLIASKWFSRHGTNWFIPIIFIILINCYIGVVFYFFSYGEFGIRGLFELLNPAHKISSLGFSEFTMNNYNIFILDYLSRVINSYLIFQTIKSFRIYI